MSKYTDGVAWRTYRCGQAVAERYFARSAVSQEELEPGFETFCYSFTLSYKSLRMRSVHG